MPNESLNLPKPRSSPTARTTPAARLRRLTLALDSDPASAQGEALGCPSVASEVGVPQETWRPFMRRCEDMGKLVFGMMQSLDGYVDGVADRLELPPPGVALGRHFTDHVRGLAG